MIEAAPKQDASLESLVARVVDEFRERQQRGERPEVEAYAARHPEADELPCKVLASLELLGRSLSGAGALSGPGTAGRSPGLWATTAPAGGGPGRDGYRLRA